jgi:hypothetical protein
MTQLLLLLAVLVVLPGIAKLASLLLDLLAKLVAAGIVIGLMLFLLVAISVHGQVG